MGKPDEPELGGLRQSGRTVCSEDVERRGGGRLGSQTGAQEEGPPTCAFLTEFLHAGSVPGSALGAEIHRGITHRPSIGGDSHTAALRPKWYHILSLSFNCHL